MAVVLIDGKTAAQADIEALRTQGEASLNAFMASRIWRPVSDYDPATADVVILRDHQDMAVGYFANDAFVHAQNWRDGQFIEFQPVEFATFDDDDWHERLMMD